MRKYLPHIKAPAIAVIILVLSLSDAGTVARPVYRIIPHADKMFHLIMYFALTIVMMYQYRHLLLKTVNVLIIVIVAFAYGVTIELMQKYLTTSRSFEYADILFNLAGIALATGVYFSVRFLFRLNR